MTQHPEYTFHRGIPVMVPSPDHTPVYDALKREYAEAAVKAAPTDPEGIGLVDDIHLRNSYVHRAEPEALGRIVQRANLVTLLGGMFR